MLIINKFEKITTIIEMHIISLFRGNFGGILKNV